MTDTPEPNKEPNKESEKPPEAEKPHAPPPAKPAHGKTKISFFKKYFNPNKNLLLEIPQLFTSLWSPDGPTRKMSLVFVLSLGCAVIVSSVATQRIWKTKRQLRLIEEQRKARELHELAEKEAAEQRRKDSVLSLGSFNLELKTVPSQTRSVGVGVLNMAELEIILMCDGLDTKDYLNQHMIQARNQLTNVFIALDRDELMSQEGKKRLKKSILRKLNSWLPHGKIEDLYFSRLLIH